jgi:hypothetical protein
MHAAPKGRKCLLEMVWNALHLVRKFTRLLNYERQTRLSNEPFVIYIEETCGPTGAYDLLRVHQRVVGVVKLGSEKSY